jgi:hypothetical protein
LFDTDALLSLYSRQLKLGGLALPIKSFNSEELLYHFITLLIIVTFGSGFTRLFASAFSKTKPDGEEAGFDFNPLANLDILGTIVFILGGFAWGRQVDDQKIRFKRQKLGWFLISLIAPYASLTLALSAGYIKYFFWTDRVVEVLISVSVAVTAYHIIPIPPLFGSRLIYLVLPGERVWQIYSKIGPFIILGLVLIDRFSGTPFLREMMAPVVDVVTRFALYH